MKSIAIVILLFIFAAAVTNAQVTSSWTITEVDQAIGLARTAVQPEELANVGGGTFISNNLGKVSIDSFGRTVVTPVVNKNWSGWANPVYGYGFSSNSTPVPMLVKGLIETDTGIIVNQAGNLKGRWGFHVFDGFGKETDTRLSMIAGKKAGTASIYYFKPAGTVFKDLQLGCDEPGYGITVNSVWLYCDVKSVFSREMQSSYTNSMRHAINSAALSFLGGTKWQTGTNGLQNAASLVLTGGSSADNGNALIYYGDGFDNGNTASVKFRHMTNSNATERAYLTSGGNFVITGTSTASGFKSGSKAGITTNLVIGGKILQFTGGLLTGVSQ